MELEKRIKQYTPVTTEKFIKIVEDVKQGVLRYNNEPLTTPRVFVSDEPQPKIPSIQEIENEESPYKCKHNINYFSAAERKRKSEVAIIIGKGINNNPQALIYHSETKPREVHIRINNLNMEQYDLLEKTLSGNTYSPQANKKRGLASFFK